MRQIEKLMQQIREALTEPRDLVAMQLLASQYAQHCEDANRRLGQCAEMIGRGNKYQTLQLAETKPSLLDLVSLLSFDSHQEWRMLCKERNLPIPEKLDEKGVRMLNELYSTGLPATEELWREFRTAIPEGDDRKALSIVRTILSRDGSDVDARREVPRLEKKIVRAKLAELEGWVERRDGAEVARVMTEIESVTPEAPPEGGVWTNAMEVRRLYFKGHAETECEALLVRVQKVQEAGEWGPAMALLAQVQSLCAQHGITFSTAAARTFSDSQAWATKLQAEHARDMAWQQALAALEQQVQVVADKEVGDRKRSLPELRDDRMLITKRWNELEQFRREVPSETVNRVRRTLSSLKAHIDRIERLRKVFLGTAAVMLLIATAVGGMFSVRYWRAREFARELGAVTNACKVLPVAKFLDELRANHGVLLGNPTLSARINEAETWLADQKAKKARLEETVKQLNATHLDSGFTKSPPEIIQQQIAQTRELLVPIAEDLRPSAESALLEFENKFDEFLTGKRGMLHGQFREVLGKAELLASSGLEFTKPPQEVRAVLAQVTPLATELDRMSNPSAVTLKPDDSDLAKFELLKNRLKKFQDETQKFDAADQACSGAATLENYLKALEGYASTAFLQSLELRSAKVVRDTVKDADALVAALLMPGDQRGWEHFKANRGRKAFYPDEVTGVEKSIFLGLRDDDNLRTIYRYEYSDPRNNVGSPYIYTQEPLARREAVLGSVERKSVTMTGRVYLPWLSRASVNFKPETFNAVFIDNARNGSLPEKQQLTPESQLFSRIGLASLVDDVVSRYQRPLLGVLDSVIAGQADPLFKGHLHSRLMELAEHRPYDWGLHWTSARKDARRLAELAAPALRSGDWMTPSRQNDLGRPLAEFYSSIKGVSYVKQAAVFSRLVEKAYTAGLLYAGYVKTEGKTHLVAEGIDALELWGYAKENLQPAMLFRRVAGSAEFQMVAEPLALTPLFFCKLDRQKTLAESCKASDIAPGHPSITNGLPPLFKQK
jgi:hypothetical protein